MNSAQRLGDAPNDGSAAQREAIFTVRHSANALEQSLARQP